MTAGLLGIPERHPGRTILAIGLAFAVLYGIALGVLRKPDGRIILGDAVHHYVQLRSLVFDRDVHFRNEYVRMYGLRGGEGGTDWVYHPTETGHVRNYMPVGPAILWAPLYLVVLAGSVLARVAGIGGPVDGYGRVFQASAGFSGILAATLGAWLTFRTCAALFGSRIAIWSTVTIWLGSSAIYYSLVSPTYSHAASMLAVSALLWCWVTRLHPPDAQRVPDPTGAHPSTVHRSAALGALAGLAAMMRWQDGIFFVLPALEAVRAPTARHAVTGLVVAAGAALLVFSPQLLVWQAIYGQPFAIPQGPDFMRWASPAPASLLFSDQHGLVSWTPVAGLALTGLVPLVRRDRRVGTGAILTVAISLYVNAAVADWWAGEAFGARRLVSCFPVFVLGLAALASTIRAPRLLAAVCTVMVGLNLLLLLQYQAFMHGLRDIAPYPNGLYGLWIARFIVPFRLLAWLLA